MSGEKNLEKLIASMAPSLSDVAYVFGLVATSDYEQVALLQPKGTFHEKEGVTVILEKEKADEYNIAYSGVFQCITLNVHSSLDAVGLTAVVATTLTNSNISANVIAACYHDHIFIKSHDADKALIALNELVEKGF
ncbi:ACT domain-containing protein [Neptunomonas japonica]|uniref:ACT domain-containing protein n=1 Tax=Neptunomonas japonica TaxID=417574 RepID=UPI0004088827|nr:ACT domain-containing protein [Neptunomonas japonica]